MRPDDAAALMAVMHGEWPKGAWLDDDGELTMRGTMFALVLGDFDSDTGAEAISRLRSRIPYRDGPQTADLKAALREVQHEQALDRPALPAWNVQDCCRGTGFGHFYRDHADDDMRERADRLLTVPTDKRRDVTILEAFARAVTV